MHGNAVNLVSQQRGLLPGKTGGAQSSYFELKNRIQSQDTYSLVVTNWQNDLQNPLCAEMALPCPPTVDRNQGPKRTDTKVRQPVSSAVHAETITSIHTRFKNITMSKDGSL